MRPPAHSRRRWGSKGTWHGPWTQQLKARLANACLSRTVGVLGRSGWMCSWSTGLASGESGGMEAGRDGTREAYRLQPGERTLSNSAVFVNLCLNPLRPCSCPFVPPVNAPSIQSSIPALTTLSGEPHPAMSNLHGRYEQMCEVPGQTTVWISS